MTLTGFLILLLMSAIIGVTAEAIVGTKVGPGWLGTAIVGLVGAWIGNALLPVGPLAGGVYLIGGIIGAVILILLLKMLTGRRIVVS
jgi:uncharacterized membrane protein YeaQ/YmgE (transglycosylase-associated protein family)